VRRSITSILRTVAAGLLAALTSICGAPLGATAQEYPSKPIHWIIPVPPESPVDIIGRRIADAVAAKLKAVIVVDNRPGASGTIGANEAAKAVPDGYTLLFSVADPFTNAISLLKSPPYDPRTAFKYISKIVDDAPMLIATSSVKANTLKELIADAKTSEISYGSFGPGSFPQIIMEALSKETGAKFHLVQYRGVPAAMHALLNNEVPLSFANVAQVRSQISEGKLKPMAAIGRRSAVLPNVPTFAEAGFDDPIFRNTIWMGLAGPTGLPPATVDKTYAALKEVLAEPALQSFIANTGFAVVGNSPVDFEREVIAQYRAVDQLIKERGITGE